MVMLSGWGLLASSARDRRTSPGSCSPLPPTEGPVASPVVADNLPAGLLQCLDVFVRYFVHQMRRPVVQVVFSQPRQVVSQGR